MAAEADGVFFGCGICGAAGHVVGEGDGGAAAGACVAVIEVEVNCAFEVVH